MSKKAVKNRKSESGNIIFYIFAAFSLMAFLAFTMTQGSNESAVAAEVQKMASSVKSDIQTIHNAIQECVLMYPDPVDNDGNGTIDLTDNPYPPFPLYPPIGSAVMRYGSPVEPIKNILCPGEYVINGKKIFDGGAGRFLSIVTSPDFTTTYMTQGGFGGYVVIEIRHNTASNIWIEAMARIKAQLDPGNTGIVVIDMVTGVCGTSGGCLRYYIIKP